MARTQVSNVSVFPQDPGTGLSSINDPTSAGYFSLLSSYYGGEYAIADYSEGMGFVNRSASNDTITVGKGACFIKDTSSVQTSDRGGGGNVGVQSFDDGTNPPSYNEEMPGDHIYLVIFHAQEQISVSDSQTNQIWVTVDVDGNNNAVELASDGGGGTTSIPSNTFIKLGDANPDDSSADSRANDRTMDGIIKEIDANLSSGSGNFATGITDVPSYFTVYLDPSGNGSASSDVKVGARAFWSNSNSEYFIEIVEDGTSVGDPTVGVKVEQY